MDGGEREIFEESIDVVERYGKCLLGDVDKGGEDEFGQLLSIMKHFCDSKEKFQVEDDIFKQFIETIEASTDDVDVNDVLQEYNSELTKNCQKLKLGESNDVYVKFKALLLSKPSKTHDDSDITTVSETISTIDPITRLPLKDPVKNLKCGHSYEKSAILKLISGKKAVRCPIPGCIAADCVRRNDLVDDVELKRYIESIHNN